MPFMFEQGVTERLFRVRFTGDVNDQDLLAARAGCVEYFRAPDRACHMIADFTAVDSFDVETKTIERLANHRSANPQEWKVVVIAPKPHIFGLMRMLSLLSGTRRANLHVFRTSEEAYKLLEMEEPEFTPWELPR